MARVTNFSEVIDRNPSLKALLHDMNKMAQDSAIREAKSDPVKHKLTKIMEDDSNYGYFSAGKNGRGSAVRYCYTVGRNVAGYFLIWREIETAKKVERDQFDATTSKSSAVRTCRELAKKHRTT